MERLEDRTLLSYFFGNAFQIGENFSDTAEAIAADSSGNFYVSGQFTGTVDFNPNPSPAAVFDLTAAVANAGYLAKYDSTGAFVWAIQTAVPGTVMTVDATGNPYLAARNVITRYDNASGTVTWVSTLGAGVTVNDLAIDNQANVIAAGTYTGTQDFDPGTAIANRVSAGGNDLFALKLTGNGTFLWAQSYGGTGNDFGTGVGIDTSDNVHVTGYFASTQIVFTTGANGVTLFNTGQDDIFILKMNSTGAFTWARSVGSGGIDQGVDVAVDGTGNVYTVGLFGGAVDFNPAGGTAVFNIVSRGVSDAFLLKLDAAGLFLWADGFGGSTAEVTPVGISRSPTGNIIFAGDFQVSPSTTAGSVTVDFDPGPGTFNLTTFGGIAARDVFITEIEPTVGNLVTANQLGGPQRDQPRGLSLDSNGNVYTAGFFIGTSDFDPRATTFNLTTTGSNSDGFVSKLLTPGFTFIPNGQATTESGGTVTYQVTLNTPPTADVTINFLITGFDVNEGTVSPASMTFTPINWSVPQTLTVTGVDDPFVDGDIPFTVVTQPVSSSDPDYNGLNPQDLFLINRDNDGAGVNIQPQAALVTSEDGSSVTFRVALNVPPTSPVTVTIASSNTGEGSPSPAILTFNGINWKTPQIVTVRGVDDGLIDGNVAYTVTFTSNSSDLRYASLPAQTFSFVNLDNDVEGIVVNPRFGLVTTESGGTATFTVRLNSIPSAPVTIGLSSTNTAEGTVSPATLIFSAADWNIPHGVTVTGVDDSAFDGTKSYTIVTDAAASGDPRYNGFNPSDVLVSNSDNESTRMYRAYNPTADYHFFTTSQPEFQAAQVGGYRDETTGRGGFNVSPVSGPGLVPLHRMYSPPGGVSEGARRGLRTHYYTTNDAERDFLVAQGWTFEKDEGYIYPTQKPGTSEVFRLYNRKSGMHLFTENAGIKDSILSQYTGIWVQHSSLGFAIAVDANGTSVVAAATAMAVSAPATMNDGVLPVQMSSTGTDSVSGEDGRTDVAGSIAVDSPDANTADSGSPSATTLGEVTSTTAEEPESVADDFWIELGRELAAGAELDIF